MMTGRDGCLPRANMLEARPGSARRWLHFSVLPESCCFTQQKTKPVPTVSDPAGCQDPSTDPSTSVQILAPGCLTEKKWGNMKIGEETICLFHLLEAANKMCLCVYSWLTSKVGIVSSGFLLTFSSYPLVWCYWVQQVILTGFKTALFIQSDAIRGNTLCCIVSSNRRFLDL